MARVTVEECLDFVENRFELVLVAAKRAHQLSSGGHRSTLDVGKDKPSVVALREIDVETKKNDAMRHFIRDIKTIRELSFCHFTHLIG
jgi:DNA-directed RNA polymerase omega subunit